MGDFVLTGVRRGDAAASGAGGTRATPSTAVEVLVCAGLGTARLGGMMPTKVLFQNPAFMVLHVLGPHPHRGTFLLLAAFGRGTRGHNPPKTHQKCMGTDASMSPDLLRSTTPAVAGVSIQNTTTGRAVGDLEMETHGPERPVPLPRGGRSL